MSCLMKLGKLAFSEDLLAYVWHLHFRSAIVKYKGSGKMYVTKQCSPGHSKDVFSLGGFLEANVCLLEPSKVFNPHTPMARLKTYGRTNLGAVAISKHAAKTFIIYTRPSSSSICTRTSSAWRQTRPTCCQPCPQIPQTQHTPFRCEPGTSTQQIGEEWYSF